MQIMYQHRKLKRIENIGKEMMITVVRYYFIILLYCYIIKFNV